MTLSPGQERFAAAVVASGRYRDVSEVVCAALDEFRQLERQRAELLASVIAAEQEGERDGFLTDDEVQRGFAPRSPGEAPPRREPVLELRSAGCG